MATGADIHADDDRAFRYSVSRGCLDVVKFLVSEGADIHVYDDGALRFAAENGHLDVVKFLVSEGADIHAREDATLRFAADNADNGHLDVVKFLLYGTNLDHSSWITPLYWEVENQEMKQLLGEFIK